MEYKHLNSINNHKDLKDLNLNQLSILCDELASFIYDGVVNNTGGHLGSSLGCVELTVALAKIFDFDTDKIIWDIGHQSYAYKILTNRKDNFLTLRTKDGISGFTNPIESAYDYFIGGHSSVSISNAFGLKTAMDINKQNGEVIAIIGDSAISSGVAFEALNHLGHCDTKMLVILNDNNMSISATTGALSNYLLKIKNSYPFKMVKEKIENNIINKLPKITKNIFNKISNIDSNLFEDLGFDYYGPIDGHNLESLLLALEIFKNSDNNKSILLHIVTNKGNRYQDMDKSNDCLHGVEAKKNQSPSTHGVSNTSVFAKSLVDLAKNDNKIVAITAAMKTGTGLADFANIYPNRFFDVGIAEQHALSYSAGLARGGLKPYVCIYSTFMQRSYDQLIHDISLANLPVKFILDRAGFVGADGNTHWGVYDYAMMLPIENMVVMAPAFQYEIPLMLDFMNNYNLGPISLRFSKEKYFNENAHYQQKIQMGRGEILISGKSIAILAIGEILQEAKIACENYEKSFGHKVTLVNLRFAKPLDEDLIANIAISHDHIITIEESLTPIVGMHIALCISSNDKITNKNITIKHLSIGRNIEQATIAEQKQIAKLDSKSIYEELLKFNNK